MSSKRESARLSKGAYTEPKEDDFSGNSSDSEDESQDTNKTVSFSCYAGIFFCWPALVSFVLNSAANVHLWPQVFSCPTFAMYIQCVLSRIEHVADAAPGCGMAYTVSC